MTKPLPRQSESRVREDHAMDEKRTYHLPFACPQCGHKNRHPVLTKLDSGTEIVVCDDCGQEVSAQLVADEASRRQRAHDAAIRKWAGWDE